MSARPAHWRSNNTAGRSVDELERVRTDNPDNLPRCPLMGQGVPHGPHRHRYIWLDGAVNGYSCPGQLS